nr:hypothetical protein [Moorena sp. SIOASIH]
MLRRYPCLRRHNYGSSLVSIQLSAISYQFSAISDQRSAISFQLSVFSLWARSQARSLCHRRYGNSQRQTADG